MWLPSLGLDYPYLAFLIFSVQQTDPRRAARDCDRGLGDDGWGQRSLLCHDRPAHWRASVAREQSRYTTNQKWLENDFLKDPLFIWAPTWSTCSPLAVTGITPRSGWAVDPFGHSATMPYLLKRANLTSMLIQRVHYTIKKHFASTRSLEFMWRQAWGEWSRASNAIWFTCLCSLSSLQKWVMPLS